MTRRPVRRRQAGLTLLELTIAFAISLTAMFLASQLLLEAQARMDHAARAALDPVGEIARRQIRADLRASSGVRQGWPRIWSWDPLVLRDHPAGRVRYFKDGTDLIREVDPPGTTEPTTRRIVLRSVTVFRWRLWRRSVEIELSFRKTPRFGALAAAGQREAPVPAENRYLFRVTPRQGGGRRW